MPLNALLQGAREIPLAQVNAIAVQNLGENVAMLLMLGLYSLAVRIGIPVVVRQDWLWRGVCTGDRRAVAVGPASVVARVGRLQRHLRIPGSHQASRAMAFVSVVTRIRRQPLSGQFNAYGAGRYRPDAPLPVSANTASLSSKMQALTLVLSCTPAWWRPAGAGDERLTTDKGQRHLRRSKVMTSGDIDDEAATAFCDCSLL